METIEQLEEIFSANDYDGSDSMSFKILEGKIPIMLSAPHAVNHERDGQRKWADLYTGGIVSYLHRVTGCHVIYTCGYTGYDPNFHSLDGNVYQQKLIEYVKAKNVSVLFDIHGSAKKRPYGVELGTAPKPRDGGGYEDGDPSLHDHPFIADIVKDELTAQFLKVGSEKPDVWKNTTFGGGKQNTVTKVISQNTMTDCIQLEINGIYRDPERQKELSALLAGLSNIIVKLASINLNNPSRTKSTVATSEMNLFGS